MTEQEARRKAIAFAVEFYHASGVSEDVADWNDQTIQEYGAQCYQQAVADMCAGEPEAWMIKDEKGIRVSVGFSQVAAIERACGIFREDFSTFEEFIWVREAEWNAKLNAGWSVIPVKLLRLA